MGLDVHAATIAVAVAEPSGEVRGLGVVPNEPEAVRKLMRRLGPAEALRVCYERIGTISATSAGAAGVGAVRPPP